MNPVEGALVGLQIIGAASLMLWATIIWVLLTE